MRGVSFTMGVLAILLGGAAQASSHCYTTTYPDLIVPDQGALGGDIYVDSDFCQLDGCAFSIWVYQETNGLPGLQRDDGMHSDFQGCWAGGSYEGGPFGIFSHARYWDGETYLDPDTDIL